jgi:hypothetical protein
VSAAAYWLVDALLERADGPGTRNRRGTPSPADVAELVSRHLDDQGRFLVRSRAVTVSAHGTDSWEGTLAAVLILPVGLELPERLSAVTAAGRSVRLSIQGPVSQEAAHRVLTGG